MPARSRPARLSPPKSALALAVVLAAALVAQESTAGVAPPDPGVVTEFREGEDIFKMRLPEKPYDGPLALCPVCGKPLARHFDPDFCRAPGRKVKSADVRGAVCPVCANRFSAPVPEPDTEDDMDRDFCRHSRGTLAQATNVWMCPKCGYAAFHRGFNRPVDEKTKSFVAETVTPGTRSLLAAEISFRPKADDLKNLLKDFSFLKQTALPEFLKYENALAIRLDGGASHHELARLHLQASHAYRRLMTKPVSVPGLDRSLRKIERLTADPLGGRRETIARVHAARRLLERADQAKSERLTNRDRLLLHVRLAGLHDRLGEVWWTSRHLKDAEELAAREPDERTRPALQDLVRRRAEHLSREVYHQTHASERFRRALAGGEAPRGMEGMLAVYLAGELLARTGEIARAVPWFEATVVLAEKIGPDDEQAAQRRDRQVLPDNAAFRLSGWATDRLGSAAFREKGGGRVAADADEKAFVNELFARRPGGRPEEAPAVRTPAPGSEGGATSPWRRPAEVAAEPGREPAGDAPPTESAPPGAPGRPADCREQLAGIWKAISAYRDLRGEFPPDLEGLVGSGLITREAAGGFVCVDSGHRLFYRRPRPGAANTFIVFHKDPTRCPCRNVLYADGAVRELGR